MDSSPSRRSGAALSAQRPSARSGRLSARSDAAGRSGEGGGMATSASVPALGVAVRGGEHEQSAGGDVLSPGLANAFAKHPLLDAKTR